MDKSKEQIEYYRKRAAEYEQIYYRDVPERRTEIDNEAARLKELVKNHRVLDIACGTGYWTEIMSHSARSITACDLSSEMIIEAKKKSYNCPVDFLLADLNELPFDEKSFDFISLGFWFSHHPRQDYQTLFEILKSFIKDDSQIWMIDNNPPAEGANLASAGSDRYQNNYKKRFLDNGEEFVIIKNYFRKDDLINIFSPYFDIRDVIFKKYYWSILLETGNNN